MTALKKPVKRLIPWIIVIYGGTFLLWVITSLFLPYSPSIEEPRICGAENLPSRAGNHWQIVSSGQPVNILWQHVQETRFLGRATASYRPNSGIIVSGDSVIVLHEFLCGDGSELNAFSLTTGSDQWQIGEAPGRMFGQNSSTRYYANIFRTLAPADDGFALVAGDHWFYRFSSAGELVWATSWLPSRSIRHMITDQDYAYLNSHAVGYTINTAERTVRETLSVSNLLAYYGDLALVADPAQHSLHIIQPATQNVIASITVNENLLESQLRSLQNRLFERFGDVLLIYDTIDFPTRIDAYNIHNGNFLWSRPFNLEVYPVVADGRLITFGDSAIQVYDLVSGLRTNRIALEFSEELHTSPDVYDPIWMAAHDDILVINFRALGDLLAIALE